MRTDADRYAIETAWWYMQLAATDELREYWRKRWEAASAGTQDAQTSAGSQAEQVQPQI